MDLPALRVGAWIEPDGAHFRVWAPDHQSVALLLGAGETARAMHPEPGGYFTAVVADARPGERYRFQPSEAGPFPDPASRSQPDGVHGASALVDPTFTWTDGTFRGIALEDLVLYEVHVGTATREGTFDALIPRLDALRELGVTAIELMPVAAAPGAHNWGYDGVALYAPSPAYGGPAGLQRLINAAHARGLAVLLDVVYNHLGPDGNYLGAFAKGFFTDAHKTPWGPAVNFAAPAVREFILANAEMWIRDFHADGLRLDATHALMDDSGAHILAEIAARARAAAPHRRVLVTAEDERNDARLVTPVAQGGYGLDAVWADDFHHQVRRAFAGDKDGYYADYTGSAADLARTLERGWYYEGQRSAHLERERGTPAAQLPPYALIHCVQNHDQVGNRALGDRLGASVTAGAFRALSTLLLVSPYTPLLFMGQEWDAATPFQFFTDHAAELGRAVTAGRRAEFAAFTAFAHTEVPDPQDPATFSRSTLDWDEAQRAPHAGVRAWYAALLALRRSHPALRARDRGSFTARAVGEHAVLLTRSSGSRTVHALVAVRGAAALAPPAGRRYRVLAASEDPRFGGAGAAAIDARGMLALTGPSAVLAELE